MDEDDCPWSVNILHPTSPMRIAIVSTPFVRVPPRGYGGTELFCGHLTEALVRRGHYVTLYATGDSQCSGDLRACFPEASWPPSETADLAHARFPLHYTSPHPHPYHPPPPN